MDSDTKQLDCQTYTTYTYSNNTKINFGQSKFAQIAAKTISVDAENKPNLIKTEITTNGAILSITIECNDIRLLKVKVNSLHENLQIVQELIEKFEK